MFDPTVRLKFEPKNTKSAAMAALLGLSDCYIQSSRLKG
jgi:hypothetical protein